MNKETVDIHGEANRALDNLTVETKIGEGMSLYTDKNLVKEYNQV